MSFVKNYLEIVYVEITSLSTIILNILIKINLATSEIFIIIIQLSRDYEFSTSNQGISKNRTTLS